MIVGDRRAIERPQAANLTRDWIATTPAAASRGSGHKSA